MNSLRETGLEPSSRDKYSPDGQEKGVMMRKNIGSLLRYVCISILSSFLVFFVAGGSSASTAQKLTPFHVTARKGDIRKILPVLEEQIRDGRLFEKSKEKIYSMDDGEVKLVAALCEKISDGGGTISSDIAFLLVTALIVLS